MPKKLNSLLMPINKSKSYFIPVELKDDKIINVSGALNLNICDFNLEPPKKALGLIVVSDIIKINFDLDGIENQKDSEINID